jgi:hypothetical protein
MKKLLMILSILAVVTTISVAPALVAYAKAPVDTGTPPMQVKCCINGECKTMAAKDCMNAGGKQVGDCKECKK